MRRAYIFWIGEKNKITKMVNELKRQNFEVFIGPSKYDDDFLSNKYEYYKIAKEQKIFSFMSDVWRLYAPIKYGEGIYIDASGVVGKKFGEMYDEFAKYDVVFPRLKWNSVAFNIFYAKKIDILQANLDIIENLENKNIRTNFLVPNIMDFFLQKNNYFKKQTEDYVVDNIMFTSPKFVVDSDTYMKKSLESWKLSKSNTDYFVKCFKEWKSLKTGRRYKDVYKYDIWRLISLLEKVDKTEFKYQIRLHKATWSFRLLPVRMFKFFSKKDK